MIKTLLTLFISFLLTACAAAVVGGVGASAASVAYVMGALEADIQTTPIPLAQATKQAFHKLGITVTEFHQTELDAKVTGYTANDDKIAVVIKLKTSSVSEMTIRVGYFGDETFSRLIYDEIIRQLNASKVQTGAIPPPMIPNTTSSDTTPAVAPATGF